MSDTSGPAFGAVRVLVDDSLALASEPPELFGEVGLPLPRAALIRALAEGTGGLTVVISGPALQVDARVADGIQTLSPAPALVHRICTVAEASLGPRALLLHAVAGTSPTSLVVGIPADPSVLHAAAQVLAPFVGLPTATADPVAAPESQEMATVDIAVVAEGRPESDVRGWQGALAAMGATLDRGAWGHIPEIVERFAPVRDVLARAGERRPVQDDHGHTWTAFGFPDLRRPGSKVILIRETAPLIEILALHRAPVRVGVCGEDSAGWLPASTRDPGPVADALVGRRPQSWGRLFAVEGDAIYLERGGRVVRWNGSREEPVGSVGQALASLVLRWSQR